MSSFLAVGFKVTSCYFDADLKGYFNFFSTSGGSLFANLGVMLNYFYNGKSG
jgi:hypothetical protein